MTVTAEKTDTAVTIAVSSDNGKPGSLSSVTVALPCEDASAGTVAVLVHADGTREVLRKSITEEDMLTVSLPIDGSVTLEIVDNSKTFEDVSSDAWYGDAIDFASSRHLLNGTTETEFNPNGQMTRAMLAQVLHNLENNPAHSLDSSFSDTTSSEWYSDAVSWAAESGYITGYSDGSFGPNNVLTREQLTVMLWRYAGSPTASAALDSFGDGSDVSDYAHGAMAWAVENGILNGTGNNLLNPSGSATRAQTAVLLQRFLELYL